MPLHHVPDFPSIDLVDPGLSHRRGRRWLKYQGSAQPVGWESEAETQDAFLTCAGQLRPDTCWLDVQLGLGSSWLHTVSRHVDSVCALFLIKCPFFFFFFLGCQVTAPPLGGAAEARLA